MTFLLTIKKKMFKVATEYRRTDHFEILINILETIWLCPQNLVPYDECDYYPHNFFVIYSDERVEKISKHSLFTVFFS